MTKRKTYNWISELSLATDKTSEDLRTLKEKLFGTKFYEKAVDIIGKRAEEYRTNIQTAFKDGLLTKREYDNAIFVGLDPHSGNPFIKEFKKYDLDKIVSL